MLVVLHTENLLKNYPDTSFSIVFIDQMGKQAAEG
jgi:hypothetical protein